MTGARIVLPALLAIVAAGCAGTRETTVDAAPQPKPPVPREPGFPRITLTQEPSTLGDTVRRIGETVGGGIVVMNGIQEMAVPAVAWHQKPYADAVAELADATDNLVDWRDDYYFIYPPGYEMLAGLRVAENLPKAYRTQRISMSLGSGTALYNAFGLLSYHLGKTIIPADIVAEARCGEMVLTGVLPATAIEAMLQSARIPAASVRIFSASSYLFIEAANAPQKGPFLLNEDDLGQEQRALLATPVNAVLPMPPLEEEGYVFYPQAIPLADALAAFGAQVGIRIAAEPDLENVPVNPCAFRNVALRTALDLFLRRWPVGGYGYELHQDHILLRAR